MRLISAHFRDSIDLFCDTYMYDKKNVLNRNGQTAESFKLVDYILNIHEKMSNTLKICPRYRVNRKCKHNCYHNLNNTSIVPSQWLYLKKDHGVIDF